MAHTHRFQNAPFNTQVLTVFLDGQRFGIPIADIQDVLGEQQITAVPLAPPAIRGVMNLRGRVVTVVDLRQRLCGTACAGMPGDPYMSVVIENDSELYSLMVDKVGDVLTIDRALENLPVTMNAAWRLMAHGVHSLKDSVVTILDPAALLENDARDTVQPKTSGDKK